MVESVGPWRAVVAAMIVAELSKYPAADQRLILGQVLTQMQDDPRPPHRVGGQPPDDSG